MGIRDTTFALAEKCARQFTGQGLRCIITQREVRYPLIHLPISFPETYYYDAFPVAVPDCFPICTFLMYLHAYFVQ